jgi:hypothetical protein
MTDELDHDLAAERRIDDLVRDEPTFFERLAIAERLVKHLKAEVLSLKGDVNALTDALILTRPQWVSIDDRFPGIKGMYLWEYKGLEPHIAYYDPVMERIHNKDYTHWMPLPAAPDCETTDDN